MAPLRLLVIAKVDHGASKRPTPTVPSWHLPILMNTIYSPTGHLAQLKITDNIHLQDARFGLDAAQRTEIEKCHAMALAGLASGGKYIRKQVERYPGNPIFLNYLGTWHQTRGEQDQAIAMMERSHERFPEYLFGVTSLATIRTAQNRMEEALQLLGPGLRIEERFPDREEFHIMEVETFENACIRYLILTEDLDRAQERVSTLRSICDDQEWLDDLEMGITLGLVAKGHAEEQAELEGMPRMEFKVQPVSPHADRELVLHHDQLRVLFNRSMDLRAEELEGILALPRETLVEDLHAIVQHSIDRFHYYLEHEEDYWYDRLSFVHHALQLLGELRGADCLETALLALSQSREYLDLYLGDWLTEDVWEPLTKMAEGNLSRLDTFMRASQLHGFSKVVVSEAVNQLGQHRPDLLPEVERWYAGLLDFYNSASPLDEVMDATQLGLMVADILDLGLGSLMPVVESLYARGYVPSNICGTIERVREQFAERTTGRHKQDMLGIVERYAEMASMEERSAAMDAEEWEDEDEWEDDGLDDAPLVTLPIKRATPKVGRNDPCPCGSGKKYKKCCEGKEAATTAGLPPMW